MLKSLQIYLFIFGTYPFQYLGDDDVLVAQMIGLVEELPKKWKPKWEHMRLNSKRKLKLRGSERAPARITRYSGIYEFYPKVVYCRNWKGEPMKGSLTHHLLTSF